MGHKDVNTTKKHYAAITEDIRKKASNAVILKNNVPMMNMKYETPTIKQIYFEVEQPICVMSNMTSGGDYNPYPDGFDEDSD